MTQVFTLDQQAALQGQPVTLEAGRLMKDEQENISAELQISSQAEKTISAIIVTLIGNDITGKQLETTEHQYLDLAMNNGDTIGAGKAIAFKDNRVRKMAVSVETVVYADGTMWKRKEQEKTNTQEQIKKATAKTAGHMKKPLIAVVALLLIAAVIFGCTKLFGPKVKAGDVVTFGHYPQTASGTDSTPIEWLVLDVKGNKALVISKYGLDAKPYNIDGKDVTWETCTLRTWLNGDFLRTAFSTKEQSAILTTTVDNSDAQGFDWTTEGASTNTTGGNNTQDKVFLLSYAEASKYFGVQHYTAYKGKCTNVKSRVEPTQYAIANNAWTATDYTTETGAAAGVWWLRSPGRGQSYAAVVYNNGALNGLSRVFFDSLCARPALWVNLDSGIF